MKGFIKVTVYASVSSWCPDMEGYRSRRVEETEYIAVSDIARISNGGLLMKTPYEDGSRFTRVKESIEDIKEFIKKSQSNGEYI